MPYRAKHNFLVKQFDFIVPHPTLFSAWYASKMHLDACSVLFINSPSCSFLFSYMFSL